MKKFLSVLLTLAVAFTFTFGSCMSAFAATEIGDAADTYTANQNTLTKEYNDCVSKLAAQYSETVASTVKVTVDKAVYETIAKEVYDTYMSVLEAQKAVIDADGTKDYDDALTGSTYGALEGLAFADVDSQTEFNNLVLSAGGQTAYFNKTMELAFDAYKGQVVAELNKINLALYADKEMTDADYNTAASVSTGNLYKTTYKQYVTNLRDKAITDVNAVGIAPLTASNADSRITDAYTAVNDKLALLDATGSSSTESVYYTVSGVNTFVSYELANAQHVPTIKDQASSALTDEATTTALKSIVDSKAAAYISANSSTESAAAEAKARANAYKEVMYSRIENEDLASFTTSETGDQIPPVSATFNTIKGYYTALEAEAATYKVMVDATGALIYDAAIIDKNLAKGKIAIYKTTGAVTTYNLTTGAKLSEQSLDWTKETKVAALKAEMEDALYEVNGDAKYYDLEQKKIEALYQAQIDKINAATTADQLSALASTISIPATITDKDDTIVAIKALTQFSKDQTKLAAYVSLLNGDTKSWEAGYKTMMDNDALADFYATNNARTNAEVAALFDAAKAECEKIPTKGEIATAKTTAEDTVKALPAYITLANKDAVEAAYKAAADLTVNYGATISNETKLNNAISQLQAATTTKLDADVRALPAAPTAADKATVDALLDEINAYETSDMYKSISAASPKVYPTYANKTAVVTAATKVRTAALNDVIAAIAALPADATATQVEAAKAKYDAFVKDYTDAAGASAINAGTAYNAANQVTNYEKLSYLVASVEAAKKAEEAAAAAKAEMKKALAIAKVTTKVTGKKIKVTAKKNTKAEYYQFKYKKGTGKYKAAKKALTNTKTFKVTKKGKYTVAVRAVVTMDDGSKVYGAWKTKKVTVK